MRMGKPDKPRRGVQKPARVDAKGKPKHAARASIVGQLSPDIISTYFAPELIERATEGLELYADAMLQYSDLLRDFETPGEAKVDADGSVKNTSDFPPPPPPTPIFHSQYWVNQLDEVLSETSQHFQSKNGGWKVHAKAARFERLMDEKYGRFRPFLKGHPEIEQLVRSMQRKYVSGYFGPFRQGKPPIPKSTAVIILFMMQRGNLRWEITMLAVLFFLVGLQPWALVVLVAGAQTLLDSRKRKRVRPMKRHIPTVQPYYQSASEASQNESDEIKRNKKAELLLQPVGSKLEEKEEIDASQYDTIILGSGPATLYTAALLSRAGRKVLVLCSKPDASGCYVIEGGQASGMKKFQNVPFDVESSNVSKVSRQQSLLAPALSTSTDYQGGIRFAQIGSPADGQAFEILSVPGMGAEGGDSEIPFVLRSDGIPSLTEDAAMSLGDGWPGMKGDLGNSTTGLYAATCEAINGTSNQFFLSKVLSDRVNGMKSSSTFQETSIRYASSFLDKGFPLNPHTRSLMAAIGMKGENIKPSMASMGAHVTNICGALSGEGMHYPIGGPRALCHALATVVEQNGGRILTHVPVSALVFEPEKDVKPIKPKKDGEEQEGTPPRCIGVQLGDKREVKFDQEKWKGKGYSPAIISMHGFITTFIRLLPDDIRVKHKVPRGLPALSERRPVFKVLFALNGSARDLDITGADFYRVPGAALAQDEVDPITGEIKLGEMGWIDESSEDAEVKVDEVNKDPAENPQGPEAGSSSRSKLDKTPLSPLKLKKKRAKFETGASWVQISFPSAKDPSFESRHGRVTTCVVTIEADDDFVTPFDTKPKLYSVQKGKAQASGDHQRLMERVRRDLLVTYPQLDGKKLHHCCLRCENCLVSHICLSPRENLAFATDWASASWSQP
jgi:hypothetical protein